MQIIRQILVFDSADLTAESDFWAAMLDGKVDADDDWHTVSVDGKAQIGVQLAPDHQPPDWPRTAAQVHPDLYVPDLAAAHEQTLAAGARLVQPAEDPDATEGFQVYASPAGHPFCLC